MIELEGGVKLLYSYKTLVAAWVPGRGFLVTDRFYSVTTSKHISSFVGGFESEKVDFSKISGNIINIQIGG
jgi:hypothetical protein